jgi:hypothetical protein
MLGVNAKSRKGKTNRQPLAKVAETRKSKMTYLGPVEATVQSCNRRDLDRIGCLLVLLELCIANIFSATALTKPALLHLKRGVVFSWSRCQNHCICALK